MIKCCNHNCRQGRDCPHASRPHAHATDFLDGMAWAIIATFLLDLLGGIVVAAVLAIPVVIYFWRMNP